jgi:predicted membrane protein
MIFSIIYILNSLWGELETWISTLYIYYIIVGLSGIALAFWLAIDGKRLERYAEKIRTLEKKFIALEQKIKIIKPRNQEKEE